MSTLGLCSLTLTLNLSISALCVSALKFPQGENLRVDPKVLQQDDAFHRKGYG